MPARPRTVLLGALAVFALAASAPAQQTYCVGAPNSEGPGASIGWSGSLSVSANDFVLTATGAVPVQYGRFVFGVNRFMKPAGDGFLCMTISRFRFPMLRADVNGVATYAVDFTAPGSGPLTAGSVFYFQYEYRDPTGPGGRTFNFSNALRAEFLP